MAFAESNPQMSFDSRLTFGANPIQDGCNKNSYNSVIFKERTNKTQCFPLPLYNGALPGQQNQTSQPPPSTTGGTDLALS